MDAVRKIIENSSNPLTIPIPKEYENKKLEVIVLPIEEEKKEPATSNDLSEFFGKLEWKGDALAEQKKLRNEWD